MIYDERTAAIDKLLRKTILPSYARPRRMDGDAARLVICDMVEVLNSAWPLMRRTQFNATCHRVARALWATYPDHAWPTTRHLAEALEIALARPPRPKQGASATVLDFLEFRRSQLKAWCRGEKPCRSHLITRENLTELAMDGVIPHGEIDTLLAFARSHQGIIVEKPREQRERERGLTGGVTIGFKRMAAE